nr:MAG TPA: hypothetical protein [Caudoviricetes sp.]DAT30892.1 MAG TPA: hypothetical protein [Bacteriophage sp.]
MQENRNIIGILYALLFKYQLFTRNESNDNLL